MTLSYKKKFSYFSTLDGHEASSISYNYKDSVVAQQLRFNLAMYRQFQASIFLSGKISYFIDGDWAMVGHKYRESSSELQKETDKSLKHFKQHLLSYVEAFRILEVNRVIFGKVHTSIWYAILRKDELKMDIFGLLNLYETNSKIYKSLDFLSWTKRNEKISTSQIFYFEYEGYYLDIADLRSHRLALIEVMSFAIYYHWKQNLKNNKEAEQIVKNFKKLENFMQNTQKIVYSWSEMREFVNSFGKEGRLVDLMNGKIKNKSKRSGSSTSSNSDTEEIAHISKSLL